MCGIVGQLGRASLHPQDWLRHASEVLQHRGPDDDGTWVDEAQGIWLAHRRLSVVDLSPAAHQPLTSAGGHVVVVLNGEIYNHRALGAELRSIGVPFRGHSDTEVVADAIEVWGFREAVERFVGMFALAAWDRRASTLHLARDRMGEKPLYVQHLLGGIRFGSELKALLAGGSPVPAIDTRALGSYMRFGYVPAPASIFEGVTKVEPGHIRSFAIRSGRVETIAAERYWDIPPFTDGGPGSLDDLEHRLQSAIDLQLQADVPVGAFLSGGIDSSLVVSLATRATRSLKTFTIGFEEPEFDESAAARRVARHLGTDHTELTVTAADTLTVLHRLPEIHGEPFADHSSIPTRLLAELARREVTVALTGDGGDELFCGYDRYSWLARTAPLAALPRRSGSLIARAGRLPFLRNPATRKVERLGNAIELGGVAGIYKGIVSTIARPADILVDDGEHPTAFDHVHGTGHRLVRAAMDADLRTYLPDDLLVKVDRASMDVSLEVRIPLLDPAVVAWSRAHPVPTRSGTDPKWPLKELLARRVPRELFDRPKMGFGVPIGRWLRGPLRPWAEELLDPVVLAADGFLEPDPIRAWWDLHLTGRVDLSFPLWTVLMFQAWLDRWGRRPVCASGTT